MLIAIVADLDRVLNVRWTDTRSVVDMLYSSVFTEIINQLSINWIRIGISNGYCTHNVIYGLAGDGSCADEVAIANDYNILYLLYTYVISLYNYV